MAAAALLLGAAGSACAATCTVASTGVSFGSFTLPAAAPRDSTGSVSVSCVGLALPLFAVPYTVSLGVSSASGSFSRAMSGGVPLSSLAYQLYRDAAHAFVWGNGSGGTSVVSGSVTPILILVPATATHFIHARVPASQSPPVGSYADTITVTIDY